MTKWILASLLGIGIVGYGLAQDHPDHPDHPKKPAQPRQESATAGVIEATVTGENFCLGCTLKAELGAAAQCSKYGHRHALKVTSATAAGKEVPELTGWVLHYLDTDNGQPYIKEHHEKTLTLKGKVYSAVRVLEVDKGGIAQKPEHPEHPK
jgi:hypothetical protein